MARCGDGQPVSKRAVLLEIESLQGMDGMGKNTSEGDLNAAIAVAKGIPARSALKHAGYSETVRKTPKKVLAGPRMQDAFRRLGLTLLETDNREYRDILESH